jgi:hypothetical protein
MSFRKKSKKLPYWLKGGLIFLLIVLILNLVYWFVLGKYTHDYTVYGRFEWIEVLFLEFPGEIVLSFISNSAIGCLYRSGPYEYSSCPYNFFVFLRNILTISVYFIIGCLGGWIYGKIKSKK